MQASNAPAKSAVPFANSGTKNTIPVASQIGITPGLASFTDGFPPLTMTPLAAGGVPPYGADFNGILNFLSASTRWGQAGAGYTYDATFSTAIGGYPKGAMLLKADQSGYWVSTADNNTSNPDTGGGGWLDPLLGRLLNVRIFSTPGVSVYTPTAGTNSIIVEGVGGGGAGGGVPAAPSGYAAASTGGGGAGYFRKRIASGFSGISVTIGAGGVPVSGASGGTGGASSFGTFCSAAGGPGGATLPATNSFPSFTGSIGSGSATGGDINASGTLSEVSLIFGASSFLQTVGTSGGSYFGGGVRVPSDTGAAAGVSRGAGGSGVARSQSLAALPGGAGAPGLVIVWEYS